jgi:hypothetical protein
MMNNEVTQTTQRGGDDYRMGGIVPPAGRANELVARYAAGTPQEGEFTVSDLPSNEGGIDIAYAKFAMLLGIDIEELFSIPPVRRIDNRADYRSSLFDDESNPE